MDGSSPELWPATGTFFERKGEARQRQIAVTINLLAFQVVADSEAGANRIDGGQILPLLTYLCIVYILDAALSVPVLKALKIIEGRDTRIEPKLSFIIERELYTETYYPRNVFFAEPR